MKPLICCSLTLSFVALSTFPVFARDIHVDPDLDIAPPADHVKTIGQAIRMAKPGDTIHLRPMVYRDYAGFYGVRGEPGKPITLDGHGATLEGSDPLNPQQWQQAGPGLFRCDNLLPYLDDAVLQRWFFLWNGEMQHMGRTSKGPRAPLKKPEELQPGEWTFLKDTDRLPPKPRQITGSFYLKLPAGQQLSDANIFVPVRSAGVQFSGTGERHNAHLVIRNLTATHPYNDGFNIHGHCEDVVFENIRAIECGDDGISAHETAQYRVDGFVSIGNSTGICDTGASKTSYDRVFIRDCLGFDLYFLDTGRYSVKNAVVLSSAVRTLHVTGRDDMEHPCSLSLENVYIRRMTDINEVRVSKHSVFDARRLTLLGLNLQATGGEVKLHNSLLTGVSAMHEPPETYAYIATNAKPRGPLTPEVVIWKDTRWTANGNHYDVSSFRFDKASYTSRNFAEFQRQTQQDTDSEWGLPPSNTQNIGANLKELETIAVPVREHHRISAFLAP